jgi:hypothetical protein
VLETHLPNRDRFVEGDGFWQMPDYAHFEAFRLLH